MKIEFELRALIFLIFIATSFSSLAEESQCEDIEPIKTVAPKYPIKESPYPQNGYVVLKFKISDRGYVYNPEVVESQAKPSKGWAKLFEQQALKAITQWHFKYREQACTTTQKFSFELQG